MEKILSLIDHFTDFLFIGLAIGAMIFILNTLMILFLKKNNSDFLFLFFVKKLYLRHQIFKINKIGLQALIYTPLIDGKKTTVQDVIKNRKYDYKDPLILEQDHRLQNMILHKNMHLIFHKKDDLSVKGFFHDSMSDKVYTGALRGINNE